MFVPQDGFRQKYCGRCPKKGSSCGVFLFYFLEFCGFTSSWCLIGIVLERFEVVEDFCSSV